MIAIVDFGLGNLRSVQKAFEFVGCEALISSDPTVVKSSEKIVIPGVGAFGAAIEGLKKSRLIDEIHDSVIRCKKPTLGICLGMQILADLSLEYGENKGLSYIGGKVLPLKSLSPELRVPHIGWSEVEFVDSPMFEGIPQNSAFYFVHSFYYSPSDPKHAIAWAKFGVQFSAALQKDNIWATQFHPEKSQKVGLRLLKNFGSI